MLYWLLHCWRFQKMVVFNGYQVSSMLLCFTSMAYSISSTSSVVLFPMTIISAWHSFFFCHLVASNLWQVTLKEFIYALLLVLSKYVLEGLDFYDNLDSCYGKWLEWRIIYSLWFRWGSRYFFTEVIWVGMNNFNPLPKLFL